MEWLDSTQIGHPLAVKIVGEFKNYFATDPNWFFSPVFCFCVNLYFIVGQLMIIAKIGLSWKNWKILTDLEIWLIWLPLIFGLMLLSVTLDTIFTINPNCKYTNILKKSSLIKCSEYFYFHSSENKSSFVYCKIVVYLVFFSIDTNHLYSKNKNVFTVHMEHVLV